LQAESVVATDSIGNDAFAARGTAEAKSGVKAPLFFPKASASMIALPAVLVAASVAALTPPVAVRLEVLVLPSSQMVLLPVRSVIPIFPAPSALPAPAEMMFQVWPPLLLFAIASQVPKLFAVPTVNGV